MKSDIAIKVEGLGKQYKLGTITQAYGTFRDAFSSIMKKTARSLTGNRNEQRKKHETIWAIKDLSFEVKHGEVLGVIGRNGAGKSTLLKVLSRITNPTKGRVELRGRVGSLLEVGTGFHPELTGRENIFLNGSILGMRRDEIKSRFDEIVAFAEIDKFLDTPVKRYSSGMYVRLAFAVAAHLEPEILLVDEVLAVGDVGFQKKCLGKMENVAQQGRTVLFVSHNMTVLKALCSRAILIENGNLSFDGNPDEAVRTYLQRMEDIREKQVPIAQRKRDSKYSQRAKIVDLEVITDNGINPAVIDSLKPLTVKLTVESFSDGVRACPAITVTDGEQNLLLFSSGVMQNLIYTFDRGLHFIECNIDKLNLYSGDYSMTVELTLPQQEVIDHVDDAFNFEIDDFDPYGTGYNLKKNYGFGFFHANHSWKKLNKT